MTVSGNLKVDTNPPPADEQRAGRRSSARSACAATWAAVSTHDGEEAVAGEVHAMLVKRATPAC